MNIKNSWKEFRIWLGDSRKVLNLYALLVVVASILTLIFYNSSRVYTTILTVTLLSVITLILTSIGIRKMPKNWRLVIEDAKKFKKEFGDKNGKIDFWISATRTNKSASTLYELLSYCRELEKLYKEKEVLDEALIDMPKRLKVVKYKIELLEDKINE